MYKVLLHNDNYNKREYVVRVLLKVVDNMSMDDAQVVMQVRWPLRRAWGGACGVGRARAGPRCIRCACAVA